MEKGQAFDPDTRSQKPAQWAKTRDRRPEAVRTHGARPQCDQAGDQRDL